MTHIKCHQIVFSILGQKMREEEMKNDPMSTVQVKIRWVKRERPGVRRTEFYRGLQVLVNQTLDNEQFGHPWYKRRHVLKPNFCFRL